MASNELRNQLSNFLDMAKAAAQQNDNNAANFYTALARLFALQI